MFSCSVAELFSCSVVQLLSCSVVQLLSRSGVQLFSCSAIQAFNCSAIQVFNCSVVQLFGATARKTFEMRCSRYLCRLPTPHPIPHFTHRSSMFASLRLATLLARHAPGRCVTPYVGTAVARNQLTHGL